MLNLMTLAPSTTLGPITALLTWAGETTLVAGVLAVLAALIARIPRLAPGPAARHLIWMVVLIKLMMPPLVHWPWSLSRSVAVSRSAPATPLLASVDDLDRPDPSTPERFPKSALVAAKREAVEPVAAPVSGWQQWATTQLPEVWRLGLVGLWLVGSIGLTCRQGGRVIGFRRRLARVTPPPSWLTAEATEVGRQMGVRVPAIRVLPGPGSPILWCLGRPVLIVPAQLLETLEVGRWRSIVAHELAHLKRGDHWVGRFELVASLVWWWNPLFWVARSQVNAEAELACDAWAVWAAPADRITYAETLLRIGTNLIPSGLPAPALGVAGSGRSFERRLTMILTHRVDRRISGPSILAAALLAALALPSWSRAEQVPTPEVPATPQVPDVSASPEPVAAASPVVSNADTEQALVASTRGILASSNDDDDDAKVEPDKDQAKATTDEMKAQADQLKAEQLKLQKKLEALGKQMAAKTKAKEAMLKRDEERLNKQMEAMGKEIEAKFGPNSEFAKSIEKSFGPDSEFSKNMEKNFGPDSVFVKDIAKNFGPDSAFTKNMLKSAPPAGELDVKPKSKKTKTSTSRSEMKADTDTKSARPSRTDSKSKTAVVRKAARIDQIEAQINKLATELKQLKGDADDDDEDEDDDRR